MSELIGAELDAAVAKAEGIAVEIVRPVGIFNGEVQPERCMQIGEDPALMRHPYMPSSQWWHGGPIIERERIDTRWRNSFFAAGNDGWQATIGYGDTFLQQVGPTPLVAAMRAFVASKS